MTIGLLKEPDGENRIALLPESVKALVALKAEIIVESQAGAKAFSPDALYTDAGAKIGQRKDVLSADLVLGINPPTDSELAGLKAGQVLMSVFQPLSNKALVEKLMSL